MAVKTKQHRPENRFVSEGAPEPANKALDTIKIYRSDKHMLEKAKRDTPSDLKMPTIPKLVHAALWQAQKTTEGSLVTADDIKTPLERKFLSELVRFHQSKASEREKDFIKGYFPALTQQDWDELAGPKAK